MAGLTKNKANSAQLGLAGAWAELGKNENSGLLMSLPVDRVNSDRLLRRRLC